jgi:fructokinase
MMEDWQRAALVMGEALVDIVPGSDGVLHPHPGGGPFNVARTIGRLQQPVAFLGALSGDSLGRNLRLTLENDGVDTTPAIETRLPTTLAIAELDSRGGAQYRFYVAKTSAGDVAPADALARIPTHVTALHVGTLGLVLEPLRGAVEAVAGAVSSDALVFLDPNCRPGLIDDAPAYRSNLASLTHRADVIKVSDDDLAWLEPSTDPLSAARTFLSNDRPRVVLLTLGRRGSVIVTRNACVTVESPATAVIDTIGAGDAFGGGFIAWWQHHQLTSSALDDPEAVLEATRFASSVAALTCARRGADPPRLADILEPANTSEPRRDSA